jgi:hypothetical protein
MSKPLLSELDKIISYDLVEESGKKYIRAMNARGITYMYLVQINNLYIDMSYLYDRLRLIEQDAKDHGISKNLSVSDDVNKIFVDFGLKNKLLSCQL